MIVFYIRNDKLHFREENQKILILKENKKSAVELEGVALTIWHSLVSKKTIDEVVEDVLKEYTGVSREEVELDVKDFIENCVKNSLIKKLKK